jgi:predicted nucleic acid-binding protein
MAFRRKRLSAAQLGEALSLLRDLPIRVSAPELTTELGTVVAIARSQGLTTYDAANLEVAMRNSAALATLDGDLKKAARRLGVSLEPG